MNVDMKLSICLPKEIIAAFILLPTLCKNGLCMESFQYMLADDNICNASQPINLPWKIHFELVNAKESNSVSLQSRIQRK